MKLELKHLAPYLPYGLTVMLGTTERNITAVSTDSRFVFVDAYKGSRDKQMAGIESIKPILRPLSDLFKLIDWDNNNELYMIGYKYGIEKVNEDGIEFYANEYYAEYVESPKCYVDITSFDWWLFENHFDVFGLIEKGLAVDINTLEPKL